MNADAKLHEHINPDARIDEHRRARNSGNTAEARGAIVAPKARETPAVHIEPAASPGAIDARKQDQG